MKRILIIDDAATVRLYHRNILEAAGYAVEEAVNGIEALEKVMQTPFDLYVVDINMPKLDGFGFIERVREDAAYRATPILVLTTESDPAKKVRAREAGATGWIVKPFHPEKLLDVIRKVAA